MQKKKATGKPDFIHSIDNRYASVLFLTALAVGLKNNLPY